MRFRLEDLVNLNALGVQPGGMGKPFFWAAGLVMVINTLPSTEAVVNDQMNGKAHWAHVAYAPLPRYEPYFAIKENNVRVPVINASTNPMFNAAAAWIKQHIGLKTRPSIVTAGR